MGNMLLRGVVQRRGREIKITRADGTMMKLRSPVFVKEILVDYPDHRIFEVAAGPRPLSERAGLIAGHLYYLIPLRISQDEFINYNNNMNIRYFARASGHGIPSASSRLQPDSSADIRTDSTKQEEANDLRSGVRIVSSSYSTDGSTVRVKLRLRKEELASFLSANNVTLEPLLVQRGTRKSALSPWKPRLDTITEPQNPLEDL